MPEVLRQWLFILVDHLAGLRVNDSLFVLVFVSVDYTFLLHPFAVRHAEIVASKKV